MFRAHALIRFRLHVILEAQLLYYMSWKRFLGPKRESWDPIIRCSKRTIQKSTDGLSLPKHEPRPGHTNTLLWCYMHCVVEREPEIMQNIQL